jgi:hypothetical protein
MKQQSTINYCGVLDGWGVMQLATMTKRDREEKRFDTSKTSQLQR